jgi:hypothetical protein
MSLNKKIVEVGTQEPLHQNHVIIHSGDPFERNVIFRADATEI